MLSTFKKTYTLPFKYDIPHYTQKYLDTTSFFKRFSKFFRRYIFIALKSHLSLEQNEIREDQKNILWVNLSAPSLGDSLMDLSSRVLLEGKQVDLFTDSKNGHIYKNDKIFNNCFTDSKDIESAKYDLVIIDSYGTKSLKTKFKYLPKLPYVGMYGHYNGPEVNRVLYSFHRMNQLLGYPVTENKINTTARAVMFISDEDEKLIADSELPKDYITIAIGGEWDYRTYNLWDVVIEHIVTNYPNENIVLLGSNNAKEEESKLLSKFENINVTSVVAKYSFNQTAGIIKSSKVMLCCDGGLMHAANSVGTDIIPLFAHLTPQMQLTDAITAYPMYDVKNVNNIKTSDVIESFEKYKKDLDDN